MRGYEQLPVQGRAVENILVIRWEEGQLSVGGGDELRVWGAKLFSFSTHQ
jgi:hypothetical protein